MSTYYKDTLSGAPIYRIAAARVTYEKADGSVGELNLAGGGGGSTAWADITGKPAFIGAGATAEAARDAIGAVDQELVESFIPDWSTLNGKPAVIAAGANAGAARTAVGAAASGANSDITSLTGLTTVLSVAQGGTGVGTSQALVDALNLQGLIAPSIGNLDTWTTGGIRCMTTSTTGRPTGTVANDLVVNFVSATLAVQIAGLSANTKLVFRIFNGSAWSAWQDITHTALA